MQTAALTIKQDIATIRITNGITNAISPDLVTDLRAAIARVKTDCRGMVLCGGEKFFSIGFDLPCLLMMDRDGFLDFFTHFNRLVLEAYTLPVPTACAVRGHAIGGGSILALAGDYRIMAQGKKFIGLNEINLGAPVPYLADMILRQLIGDRAATEMLYKGELLTCEKAAQTRLADSVVVDAEVEQTAVKKVLAIAKLPRSGFKQIKENRVEFVKERYEKNGLKKNKNFVDCWFLPGVQDILKKAVEKF